MLRFPKLVFVTVGILAIGQGAVAQNFNLGRPANTEEISAWDKDIRPDGLGLPAGQGSVLDGEEVFVEKCAMCHGDFGEGVDRWPVLAGGHGSLQSDRPVKTIGSFWPYLSTLWDYIHRAMPFGDAQSLSVDEVYAITAYLLYMNDVVEDEDFVLSHENFADVELSNQANFYPDDRESSPIFLNRDACMADCKDEVQITMRAAILDVTPDTGEENKAKSSGNDVQAANPEQIAMGAKLFRKCKSCHQVGEGAKNRVGPTLNGIIGRTAASIEGFKYSKAMKASGITWDVEALSEFLKKPKLMVPKTKMSFIGLKKQEDIDALIAYLRTQQ